MPKTDRRRVERFDLNVPAIIHQPMGGNDTDCRFLLTRDISSGGAYFHSMKPLSYEPNVRIELLFKVAMSNSTTKYMYMTTAGEIMRCDEDGIAVKFHGDYSLTPFV
jgi:hypothetical protein